MSKEVTAWQESYDKMGHKNMDKDIDVKEASQNLTDAMDKLPEMTEKKKRIDVHNNIATYILKEIESRNLD